MTNKLTSQEIVDMNKEYTFFSWSVQGQVNPIPVTKAEGVYFWDADDKRYLDFSSQLMNANIGHQHLTVGEPFVHLRPGEREDEKTQCEMAQERTVAPRTESRFPRRGMQQRAGGKLHGGDAARAANEPHRDRD